MKYMKFIVILAIIVYVGFFIFNNYPVLNKQEMINMPLFEKPLGPAPIIVYLSVMLFLGMLITGVPALCAAMRRQRQIKQLTTSNQSLLQEVEQLQQVNQSLIDNSQESQETAPDTSTA